MRATMLILSFLATTAFCDQAAVISKKPAERAVAILKTVTHVIHYCAPCGDRKAEREAIKSVAFQPWNGGKSPDQFSVSLNDRGIDLAYVYVEKAGMWLNLARLVNVEVSDVPTVLDDPPQKTKLY